MSGQLGDREMVEMDGLIAGLYASPADIIVATREALHGDRK